MPKLEGAAPRPTYQLDELLVDWFMVFVSGKFRCCVTGCDHVWDGCAENGARVVLEVGAGTEQERIVGEICQRHVDELTAHHDPKESGESATPADKPQRPSWVLGPRVVHVDGLADAYAAGYLEGWFQTGARIDRPADSEVAAEFGLWYDETGLTEDPDTPESDRAAQATNHNKHLLFLLDALDSKQVYAEDFDPSLLRRLADALKIPPFWLALSVRQGTWYDGPPGTQPPGTQPQAGSNRR
jgi:hypothetical protein